jgi:hypothetical protein
VNCSGEDFRPVFKTLNAMTEDTENISHFTHVCAIPAAIASNPSTKPAAIIPEFSTGILPPTATTT